MPVSQGWRDSAPDRREWAEDCVGAAGFGEVKVPEGDGGRGDCTGVDQPRPQRPRQVGVRR